MTTRQATRSCWMLLINIRGGHKFFRDVRTGRIAVADQSGSVPETTDDGILWLDIDKIRAMGKVEFNLTRAHDELSGIGILPLMFPDGAATSTFAGFDECVWVARQVPVRMFVKTDMGTYEVMPSGDASNADADEDV